MWITVLLATSAWTLGCGGGGAGSVTPPPPPPPSITVSVTPSTGSVLLGETLSFSAVVSNTTDIAVIWSVNGIAGGSAQAGTISADGIYTAPTDVQTGASTSLLATLTPIPGSNPNNTLSWSPQGTGCTGSACGVLTVTTTQAAGVTPIADTATYTAPLTAPQPDTILITVTPQADPSKAVQANITVLQGTRIGITPPTATLAANHRVTLTVAQGGSSGGSFNWSVNGVAGGNVSLGQICVTGSSPCQTVTSSSATQVDYLAPGSIPLPKPVPVTVSIAANPALAASAQITVLNHVVVSVLPNSATLAPLAIQSFTASVLSSDQNVTWQIQGTGCGAAGSCGTVVYPGRIRPRQSRQPRTPYRWWRSAKTIRPSPAALTSPFPTDRTF